ncbi:MAG: hypothetical protein KME21_28235 [Desmonostoc vinosum HA7617-LM4]|jgi:acrosin|nr:hypothetical protein [Desmonostoc vinosum HA7617-LM4]
MDANQPLELSPLVTSDVNPLLIEGLTGNRVTFTGSAAGDSLYLRVNADILEYSIDNTNYTPVELLSFSSQTQITVNLLAGDNSLFVDASLIQALQDSGGQASFTGGADADTIFGPGGVNVTWNVTGANTGNIAGVFGFTETENLTGRGNDTLVGANQANLWTLNGNGTGTLNGQISFNNIANLTGGSVEDTFIISDVTTVNIDAGAGADRFRFNDGVNPTGLITGGAGNDFLDFTTFPTAINLTLNGADTTGFNGTGTVSFAGIDTIVGTENTRDTLTANPTAFSESVWNLDAEPTFSDRTRTP